MNKKVNIAIDAMGGENSPKKVIDGINISLQSNQENFFFIYGQQDLLEKEIAKKKALEEKKRLKEEAKMTKELEKLDKELTKEKIITPEKKPVDWESPK